MTNRTPRRLLAASAAVALVLGGCGKGGSSEPEALVEGEEGTTTFRGSFANVDEAPEGSGEVTGLAEMVVGKGRTTVHILVSGLTADTTYYGTLNTEECSASDPGGGLYRFDPDKPEEHPNIVQFEMGVLKDKDTELAAGSNAEATYEEEASSDARSVVLRVKRKAGAKEDEKDPPKLACADLRTAEGSDTGTGGGSPDDEETSSPSPSASPSGPSASAEEAEESPSPSPKSKKKASPSPSPSQGS